MEAELPLPPQPEENKPPEKPAIKPAEPVLIEAPKFEDLKVDVNLAAKEAEAYLNKKKLDLIDYNYVNIECYPPPDSDDYPELKKFAAFYEKVFDYGDKITDDEGKGFPHELLKALDAEAKKIEDAVNQDAIYWEVLRGIVIPLYERSPHYDVWKEKRWKAIKLGYDPIRMEVKSTEIFTNKKTGEKTRGRIVSQRMMPPGFVIKVY